MLGKGHGLIQQARKKGLLLFKYCYFTESIATSMEDNDKVFSSAWLKHLTWFGGF